LRTTRSEDLKLIPSVDAALRHLESAGRLGACPRPIVVRAVRGALETARTNILTDREHYPAGEDELRAAVLEEVERAVRRSALQRLMPVINATGVLIHTNLGRAPLSGRAAAALAETGVAYSDLEYDLDEGSRGRRGIRVEEALCELTGAEDALVVNNNAAAVLLALNTIALGRKVLICRGELIEIGGSFRLPEVFERSGATMIEVGTTNRTRLEDFRGALCARTAAIMSAHWSNYAILGFVERVGLEELVELGGRSGVPVIHDLGSGAIVDTASMGLPSEMTVAQSIKAGAAVATFSGDKLLGGPQAGIAVGDSAVISRMRSNPLTRALRPGKLTLAALEATLDSYLEGRAAEEIPVLRMISAPLGGLEQRARALKDALISSLGGRVSARVVDLKARVGGGALPTSELESKGLEIAADGLSAREIASRMRGASPPVVVRTSENRVLVDLRTVLPEQDPVLLEALKRTVADDER
jgi:L-seryl-tRNA(Ser) seleniumtransferase